MLTRSGFTKPAPRIVALAAAILFGGVMAASLVLPVETWGRTFAGTLHTHGVTGAVLGAGLLLICMLAGVPASPLVLVAGLLYGPWAIPLSWICAVIAATVSFHLARNMFAGRARKALNKRLRLRLIAKVIDEESWCI